LHQFSLRQLHPHVAPTNCDLTGFVRFDRTKPVRSSVELFRFVGW
jgi:hypothetical protein